MLEIHDKSSFKDLQSGLDRLKQGIEARNASEKVVVKKHFSKFVNAKTTVDSFYSQMLASNLINHNDYGVRPFACALETIEELALKLYGPLLDRKAKVDKIMFTLSVLEQWRFFFNLASSLSEMIKKVLEN